MPNARSCNRSRRRSLRRGYKVEEVDSFLDRVEAMLNGERVEPPVRSKDVHDIVFRVKFGGYDEWQVDLHLDRVERVRGALPARPAARGAAYDGVGIPACVASAGRAADEVSQAPRTMAS